MPFSLKEDRLKAVRPFSASDLPGFTWTRRKFISGGMVECRAGRLQRFFPSA